MRFSEAIVLGAMTQPLCKGEFIASDGKVCLLVAAVRACGEDPVDSVEASAAAFKLWPWLRTKVQPPARPNRYLGADYTQIFEESPALDWVVLAHDAQGDASHSLEWIASRIAELEEHLAQEEPAVEPVEQEVPCTATS